MQVIVVGGGETGRALGRMLLAGGHQVTMVEIDPAVADRLRSEAKPGAGGGTFPWTVITGDGADAAVLKAAGAPVAQAVAAVTGADETNLVVASLARLALGTRRVIARVKSPSSAWLFTPAMGVDVAVNQAGIMAHLIAEEMDLGDMLTLLKLRRGQHSLVEEKVHPAAAAAGRAVKDLAWPAECVLAAVIRGGRLIIPRGPTVLQAGDEVLAVVHADQAGDLAALLGPGKGNP